MSDGNDHTPLQFVGKRGHDLIDNTKTAELHLAPSMTNEVTAGKGDPKNNKKILTQIQTKKPR